MLFVIVHWNILKANCKFVNWYCLNPIYLFRSFHWLGEIFHSESESTVFAI